MDKILCIVTILQCNWELKERNICYLPFEGNLKDKVQKFLIQIQIFEFKSKFIFHYWKILF